ncbi:MAG: hypothetical protein HRU70_04975 [Phycisphaeraceae bacterium]|nr:MAG: hypothetical protein HRU70_04975 [Phycisphaeraceae bacterium]
MTTFLERVLNVTTLRLGDEGVQLDWARPIPGWGWMLIVSFAFAAAVWAYRRLPGSHVARVLVATPRALTIVLVAVLLAGPRLAQTTQTVERDWVVIMADRSASLATPDAPGGVTRDQQLLAAVRENETLWKALATERNVLWLGFAAQATELPTSADRPTPDLGEPAGASTRIGRAIDAGVRQLAARPVAGIVLLTDGRTTDQPSRSLVDQLATARVPVFPVPLGSATPRGDLAVLRVQAPASAYVNDTVPVAVELERTPGQLEGLATAVVQLVDAATGEVIDEKPLPEMEPGDHAAASGSVTLSARPSTTGAATWTVRVVSSTPDITPANDQASFAIRLVDAPVRVVYFDGYPRWEYRYLKNIMVRERSLTPSALLLAAQRRFIQEGSETLLAVPRTQAEWRRFDVIILGDIRPEMFSADQLKSIKDHVARDGGGLLWIGGPSATPAAWRETPLADLIPFSLAHDPAETGGAAPHVAPFLEPVLLRPTPAAQRLGVLQLGPSEDEPWPAALLDPASGWSSLRFAQRIDPSRVKPAAETLAQAVPSSSLALSPGSAWDPDIPGATPIVLTMRYGSGRVVYVGTDETWRWRYGRGETLPERFWIPLIRLLARDGLGAQGLPARLDVSPSRALTDQPLSITLRLFDQSLLDARPASVRARVIPAARPDRAQALTLTPDADTNEPGAPPSVFSALWVPSEPGAYTVEIADPLFPVGTFSQAVDVTFPDDERRLAQTDHALLADLAQQTGGEVLDTASLSRLPSLLPNRELRLVGAPIVETLWDKPFVLGLLLTLLVAEWVGRRVIHLA